MDDLCRKFEVAIRPDLWRQPDQLMAAVNGCRALIVRNQTRVTAELIRKGQSLRVIGRAGAGLDNIDVDAARCAGVPVVSTPDQNSISVAELTFGMMLSLVRKLAAADRDTKAGNWSRQKFVGRELFGKTIGIIGFGRIGFMVAMRARAFGMRILAFDRFVGPDAPTVVESGTEMTDIDSLLAASDFVSCHLPSTADTRGFLDKRRLSLMKPGAIFLNLSRGDVVDEQALVDVLQSGRLGGAALDVRAKEPPEPGPLDRMDNVILTPHIAAFTVEAQDRVVAEVCRRVTAILQASPVTS